jgi:hypothetical protein
VKNRHTVIGLVATLLVSVMPAANADLRANLLTYQAHQQGLGASVRIGTVVTASTSLPSIWANASFRVECQEPNVRTPITGSRGWSDNGLYGPKTITVTAPTNYTTAMGLSGWNSIMAGTRFDCVFTAEGAARTNLLPIGGGGSTIPLGGDVWNDSDYQVFSVIKPGNLGTGGCIV